MTAFAEEDVGLRALLDILAPAAHAADPATGTVRRKKQRFCLKKRRLREEGVPEVEAEPRPTSISIVERLSSETVSVCWSDARMGRYSEQIWRLGRARTDSFCMLTGRPIRYGDRIFRPRTQQGYLTSDHNRMILACAVDDLCCSAGGE